ncbi:protein YgfX [Aromatoleum aromaticum]|uniref:Toxin CptA n=1 Tax=Aromatoleum aromaticum (strain DSM 19018 / LMG 30748 / EbN1) TaxID=76114 RepID=Q5P0D1_AROAE|nr:protein YgfX [Aromatoleum aromaticum]NMG53894.1 hypothetical protein [Aromatoleum aromaticum]CAI09233.1 hypothetical protein ebA5460 [Aromatoleum aromaticum EbN1]
MRYPLELPLRPSRQALVMIAAIHTIAAIAFLRSSLSALALYPVLFVLAVSLFAGLRVEWRKTGRVLTLENDGTLRDGCEVATLAPETGCTDFGWAVWLQWRRDEAEGVGSRCRGSIMLLPDNLPRGHWRGLRIWLRQKIRAAPEGAQVRENPSGRS